MWVLKIPLSSPISKNKKFILNLNHYRNAHYMVLSKAKRNYEELIHRLLGELNIPFLDSIQITYRVFYHNKARIDVANICSIADKFFSDALVDYGILEDDNVTKIPRVIYEYGGVNKYDPHILVIIEPIKQTEIHRNTMRVLLNNDDIQEALINHIESLITVKEGQNISFTLVPDGDGFNAEISIGSDTDTPVAPKTPRRASRKSSTDKGTTEPATTEETPDEKLVAGTSEIAPTPEPDKNPEPETKAPGLFSNKDTPEAESKPETPTKPEGTGLFGNLSMVTNK